MERRSVVEYLEDFLRSHIQSTEAFPLRQVEFPVAQLLVIDRSSGSGDGLRFRLSDFYKPGLRWNMPPRVAPVERRVHELERSLADAQARTRRFDRYVIALISTGPPFVLVGHSFGGRLAFHGCISTAGLNPFTVVWPPGYSLSIVDGEPVVRAVGVEIRMGRRVVMGGGECPHVEQARVTVPLTPEG